MVDDRGRGCSDRCVALGDCCGQMPCEQLLVAGGSTVHHEGPWASVRHLVEAPCCVRLTGLDHMVGEALKDFDGNSAFYKGGFKTGDAVAEETRPRGVDVLIRHSGLDRRDELALEAAGPCFAPPIEPLSEAIDRLSCQSLRRYCGAEPMAFALQTRARVAGASCIHLSECVRLCNWQT